MRNIHEVVGDDWRAYPHDSTGLNLHYRLAGRSDDVLIFIHGLNGHGYATWGELLPHVWAGAADTQVDIAVCYYPSLLKRMNQRALKLEQVVERLSQQISELGEHYHRVHLAGHSLGGLLAEAAAKDRLTMRSEQTSLDPLASTFLFAAPRAGSGWAVPLLRPVVPDFKALGRLSGDQAYRDRFLSSKVQRNLINIVQPGGTLVPTFAIIGSDWFVKRFSALFGVPDGQRLNLPGGHSAIVKPPAGDRSLANWIFGRLREVSDLRAQHRREDEHAVKMRRPKKDFRPPLLVTEFWTDNSDPSWEHLYNHARGALANDGLVIQDRRLVPELPADLLISVCSADAVTADAERQQGVVVAAHSSRKRGDSRTVGLSPVGSTSVGAEAVMKGWLQSLPFMPSVYVEGAQDAGTLRRLMTGWLQLAIDRDGRGQAPDGPSSQLLDPVDRPFGDGALK